MDDRITQLLRYEPLQALPSVLPNLRQLVALLRAMEARVAALEAGHTRRTRSVR